MLRLSRVLALAAVTQLSLGTVVPAQDLALGRPAGHPNVPRGERIRITVGGLRVEGTVASSNPDGLTLLMKNGVTYRTAVDAIDRLEVARRRGWLAGAGRGALIGGLSVAAMAAAALPGQKKEPDGTCTDSYGAPQICTTGGQVAEGLAMGALTGAVIGMLFPGTTWHRVESAGVRVGVTPAPGGGVAVRAAVTF